MSRGYFGIGIYRPKHEVNVGTLWRTAYTYGAAYLVTIGGRYRRQASDTCTAPSQIPLYHLDDVAALWSFLPYSCPLIGVELDEVAVPLESFTHPPRGLYLLGAEDDGLPEWVLRDCHHRVKIASPAAWSLNVATAGAIVMHDRYMKEQARV